MFRIKARYRVLHRRLRPILVLLRKDIAELLRFLLRGRVAGTGAGIVATVGLAEIGPSFVWGYLLVCVSTVWGIAAWMLSDEVRKHEPAPLKSQKLQEVQKYKLALSSYRRWQFIVPGLISLFPIGFMVGHLWPQKQATPPTPSSVPLTALYIGCEFAHIPITIQPGTSVHVMWLDPTILRGNPNIPFLGPFDDIAVSAGERALKWPTGREGRWMKRIDIEEAMKLTKILPSPYAYHCTLNNYGATLDEIAAQLIVDTSDEKRHAYDVQFDPSVLGHPFEFYIINKCSSEVVPTMAQWGNTATVRILGETNRRKIPLQFERKAFPSDLMPAFGASWFIWNDRKGGCKWDN